MVTLAVASAVLVKHIQQVVVRNQLGLLLEVPIVVVLVLLNYHLTLRLLHH